MRKLNLLLVVVLGGSFLAGCGQKSPEEIEADKYPKAKANTPEQDAALRAKFDLNGRGSAPGKGPSSAASTPTGAGNPGK